MYILTQLIHTWLYLLMHSKLKSDSVRIFCSEFPSQVRKLVLQKLVPAFRNVTSSVAGRLFSYNAVAAEWGCAHDLGQSGAKLQPINPTPSSLRRVVSYIISQTGVSRRRSGCPFFVLASLNLSSRHANTDASNLHTSRLRQNWGRLRMF
jgi:hypothetical protein